MRDGTWTREREQNRSLGNLRGPRPRAARPLPLRERGALLGLIFLFRISLRAVLSVLGRRSPWGLSPYRPLPPQSRPTSAGAFLFLTSASMSQSADSPAGGLPRAQGSPVLQVLVRWLCSLSGSVSTDREHIILQGSRSRFGSLSSQHVFLLYDVTAFQSYRVNSIPFQYGRPVKMFRIALTSQRLFCFPTSSGSFSASAREQCSPHDLPSSSPLNVNPFFT